MRHAASGARLGLLALAALFGPALALAGCGLGSTPGPTTLASPVDGVIVAIDASGLSDVRGFTLRMAGGSQVAFKLGNLENPTQFPPGHLAEHEATSQPVRVYFIAGPDGPVVYRLEDEPGSSAPPGFSLPPGQGLPGQGLPSAGPPSS